MKVVMITNSINQIGGIERVICNLANGLNNKNISVEIISIFSKELKSIFKFNKNIKINHLNLEFYHCDSIKGRFKNNFLMRSNLYDKLKNINCDIVITFHPFVSEWMSFVRKKSKAGYKLVMTDHLDYRSYSPTRRILNIVTYLKSDQLVVLTEDYASYYRRYIKDIVVIPNGIDNIQKNDIDYSNKNIICAGRVEEVKGFDLAIESFSKIANKYNEWKLVIVGDGSQRENLKRQVSNLNLEKRVIFLGFKDNIIEEFNQASIFVLSSRFEGFPMVLLEAMSCGLSCISYDAPWSRDVITDKETGLMADYLDIDDLADKMEELLSSFNSRKTIGVNGKKEVEKFLLDNVITKWEEVLHNT